MDKDEKLQKAQELLQKISDFWLTQGVIDVSLLLEKLRTWDSFGLEAYKLIKAFEDDAPPTRKKDG